MTLCRCSCRASKRRKEEVAEQAEDEEADDPVDRVDVDDDHVHVKAPALRVVLKVHGVQTVASSVGELAPADGCGRPLEAWIGWQKRHSHLVVSTKGTIHTKHF